MRQLVSLSRDLRACSGPSSRVTYIFQVARGRVQGRSSGTRAPAPARACMFEDGVVAGPGLRAGSVGCGPWLVGLSLAFWGAELEEEAVNEGCGLDLAD